MKKISLITIHLGANFGSILQTIATVNVLTKHGYEATVINYIPNRCTLKRFLMNGIRSLSSIAKLPFLFPLEIVNRHIYNTFLSKYTHVSKPIFAEDDFQKVCPQADIYMTGSDQVWNSVHNEGLDRHYYFDGFPDKTVKIAYSSSIGREELPPDEYKEVKRMLSGYKAIAVREESAKRLIDSMGYETQHLVDPTFMLNREDWQSYMSDRIIKESYLYVYLPYNIHDKHIIYQTVHVIAKLKHLKVVASSWHIRPEKMADKTVYFSSPGDFLSLMYHADYVVTNSFHGTAFSINLNKQFSVYLPSGFGTRISSVLNLCGLNSRLLNQNEVISEDKALQIIDYVPVNGILDEERKKAHCFLAEALKD